MAYRIIGINIYNGNAIIRPRNAGLHQHPHILRGISRRYSLFGRGVSSILFREATNQKLLKLKSADKSKMFKYRLRDKALLEYFHNHAAFVITLQPFKAKGTGFGILGLSERKSIKVHSVASILKKELKMEESEGLHIYRKGTMMQDYQRI